MRFFCGFFKKMAVAGIKGQRNGEYCFRRIDRDVTIKNRPIFAKLKRCRFGTKSGRFFGNIKRFKRLEKPQIRAKNASKNALINLGVDKKRKTCYNNKRCVQNAQKLRLFTGKKHRWFYLQFPFVFLKTTHTRFKLKVR